MKPMSTYTVKGKTYEIVDKQARAQIKEIMAILANGGGGETASTYSVTYNLDSTKVDIDNTTESVDVGGSYYAQIEIKSGYTLRSGSITMGGTDVTETVVVFGADGSAQVQIPEVTGDIVITVETEAVVYTVQASATYCSVSNTPANIGAGGTFSGTITYDEGCTLDNVAVYMGETDVTETAVNGNEISIDEVTDEVAIYVEASDGSSEPETSDAETFSITNNLTDVSTDNDATTVANGAAYTATLTRDIVGTWYLFVYMGGVAVTSQVVKSVDADTYQINIESVTGDVVITASLHHYERILSDLTKVSNDLGSYESHLVEHGSAYNTKLTADYGYSIASVRVKMGDLTDITSEVYDKTTHKISIPEVTDTVYITAIARKQGTAENLADPTSSEWLTDMRLWLEAETPSEFEGAVVTNWIPCYEGDVVRVKGMNITRLTEKPAASDAAWLPSSAVFGDYAKARNGSLLLCNNIVEGAVVEHGEFDWEYTVGGYDSTVNNATKPMWWGGVKYIRFNGYLEGDASDVVITVNNFE